MLLDDDKWDHVMRSGDHDITIASFESTSSVEHVMHQRCWYLFCGMGEKISCLSDKKVRKKNQIPDYYASSPKEYNEDEYKID